MRTAATTTNAATVAELIDSYIACATLYLDLRGWAEDEIEQAIKRHTGHRDALYHSIDLLKPPTLGGSTFSEFAYRSHAAELLERVVSGADTRQATAAELSVVCAAVSLVTPMHGAAAGLYFRVWARAFPRNPLTAQQARQRLHYEELFGAQIDELEAGLRRNSADPNRVLRDIKCNGWHHGKPVNCLYAVPSDAAA